MKVCPQCDRDYDDEARFCLIDGTGLVDGEVMPTVAINATERPTEVLPASGQKAPKKILVVIGATLGMLILIAISFFLLTKTAERGNAIRENQNLRKKAAEQTPAN